MCSYDCIQCLQYNRIKQLLMIYHKDIFRGTSCTIINWHFRHLSNIDKPKQLHSQATNIWGTTLVVYSTAHWWLRSSLHLLYADLAQYSLKYCKCCLWSLQRTYGVHNVHIFQMQWGMQKSRWIRAKGFFSAFFIRYDERLQGSKLHCNARYNVLTTDISLHVYIEQQSK